MSDALKALLASDLNIEKNVHIKRLGVDFIVKALTDETLEEAREEATHFVGKGAKQKKEVDTRMLGGLLISKACVEPDFNHVELIKAKGAKDAADVVTKTLLPGEIEKLQMAILELSGFEDDEEEIEEVKN
ncbi:phage tail assembly chaperone [Mesobacillus zeae]|uniref:XkdN-like protein n=1 Tax=Mesobacillus zeae TaxID=1917180 RepID=A0A398BMF0_9BACI|nr:hypothetical protein [Mesobacillus zeae]RID88940.1 hypothetical protein D1970_00100 [Mesobacillus zeae]